MDAHLATSSLTDPVSNFFKRSGDGTELRRNLQLSASGPIERVLIHFAMEAEARPLLAATNARPFLSILPLVQDDADGAPKVYTYEHGGIAFYISTNGEDSRFGVAQVGTGPSSTAVLLSAIAVKPSLIINAGTAGGFNRNGGEVGDVYLGTGAVFHDHRIPLPHYRDYGRGFYPTLRTSIIQSVLRLKQGIVTTGGSLDCSAEDAAEILALDACVKDMEAAEVARVAVTLKIPFITLKAVTDLVDDSTAKTPQQFESNFDLAVAQLTDRLLGFERFLTRSPGARLELL